MIPHNTPVRREKVAVMLKGVRIGDGTVSENGTVSILLTHPDVVGLVTKGEIQHLSIDPTYKQ